MTSPNTVDVTFGGDPSGAIAAAAAAQAAIDRLHGRDLTININTNASGIQDASRHLGALNRQMDRATGLSTGLDDVGDRFERLGGQVSRFGKDAEAASTGMSSVNRQLGTMNRHVARSAELGEDMDRFADRAGRLGGALGGVGGAAGRGVGGAADTVDGLGRGLSASLGAASSLGSALGTVGPAGALLAVAVKGMTALTTASGYAAAGAGVVTGAVGALGVASVGAFGLVGAGMGMGAAAFTEHAVEVLGESAKFRREFAAIGRDAKAWEEDTYAPIGEAVVGLAKDFRLAGPQLGAPIKAGLGVARDAVLDASPDLVRGSQVIADSIGRITTDTAPSIGVLARSVPALATSTTGAVEEITRAFNAGFQDVWPRAVPHVQRLTGAVGEFGAEIMRVGAANLIPTVDGLESLTEHATAMTRNLGPSIPKAMSAFVDVGNIVMDSLGSPQVAEGIDRFTGSIERNRGPLTALLGDIGEAGFSAGSAFVEGLAQAEPAFASLASTISENQPAITGITRDTAKLLALGTELGVKTLAGAQDFGQAGIDAVDYVTGVSRDSSGMVSGFGRESNLWSDLAGFADRALPFMNWTPAAPPPGAPGVPPAPSAPPITMDDYNRAWGAPLGRSREVPSDQIGPAQPFELPPGLPEYTDERGRLWGPKVDAINKHLNIPEGTPHVTDPGDPRQVGPAMFAPNLPALPPVPMPGPAFGYLQPGPSSLWQPPPPPVAEEPLLEGARPRVGSSFGGVVRRQIQDAAPEVEQAGADLGMSAGAGLDQGITLSVTRTQTVMRRTIRKVVDVAADELDAHSPSRVFEALGRSIPEGLAVGVTGHAALAEAATARMTSGAVSAGMSPAALHRAGQEAGQSYATGLTAGQPSMSGMGAGMAGSPPAPAPPPRFDPSNPLGSSWAALARSTDPQVAAQTAEQESRRQASMAAITAARQSADSSRRGQLERMGWNPETVDRVMEREARHQERAEGIRERAQANKERAMRAGTPMSDAQFSDMLAARKPGKTSYSWDSYTPSSQGPNPGGQAATAARAQGRDVGQSYSQGVGQGVEKGAPRVAGAGKTMSKRLDDATRDALEIRSPSRLAAKSGAAYADGLIGPLDGIAGQAARVASDRGLQLGDSWAHSVVSGAAVVLRRSELQTVGTPKVAGEQARTALGALGLLGPAGSGASIYKTPSVSFAAATQQVNVKVQLDLKSDLLDARTDTRIQTFRDGLIAEISDALNNSNA